VRYRKCRLTRRSQKVREGKLGTDYFVLVSFCMRELDDVRLDLRIEVILDYIFGF